MSVRILIGDACEQLRQLPEESVHCCISSPPYWGLRDYGVAGQLGMEPTLGQHIEAMVGVFREVRRVLRKDGTVWLNYGDCYAGSWGAQGHRESSTNGQVISRNQIKNHPKRASHTGTIRDAGLKPKDLCMMPARVALALQADGWWLRSMMPWVKRSAMPESVTDRPATAIEYVFLFTKSARYFFDMEAVKQECESGPSDIKKMVEAKPRIGGKHKTLIDPLSKANANTNIGQKRSVGSPDSRNFRNSDLFYASLYPPHGLICSEDLLALDVNPQSFPGAHFATFPPKLIEPLIRAGTSEKGCCPECGAPLAREVERGQAEPDHSQKTLPKQLNEDGRRIRDIGWNREKGGAPNVVRPIKTLGWRPSCDCFCLERGEVPFPLKPCTVLDPFSGAGTTGLVADRLKRNAILIELNPEYAAMARARIQADGGMFVEVTAA